MANIRLRTKTPKEIRATLNRIMNMTVNGQMDHKTANTLILACNAVLNSIRTDDQQKKIDQLETLILDLDVK